MKMSSEIMPLIWNNHNNMVKQNFGVFLERSVLADCTISAEGQHLKAHKIMLAACSLYFEKLFSQDNMNNPVIILKDVKFYIVKAVLHFMYNGAVMILQDHLEEFIDVAESLQIKGLEDKYKKYDLRKPLKRQKLDINAPHDISADKAQMKTNYSGLNDIDETSLTVGISKLSMNSDNCFPYHIQNTAITVHSLPTLTSFELLNNVKFSQKDVPGIKPKVQSDSQTFTPENKNTVQSSSSGQLEESTTINKNTKETQMSKDVDIQQTTHSQKPVTSMKKHHHKSVQLQKARKITSHADVTTARKQTNLTTSERANYNVSTSLPVRQTQNTSKHSSCITASCKPDKLKINAKKRKRRCSKHFCENCEKTFSSMSSLKKHHCTAYMGQQNYFTLQECEMSKRSVKAAYQLEYRGAQSSSCQFCHKAFKNIKQLQSHIYDHRSFMNVKHLQNHFIEDKEHCFMFQEWDKTYSQNNLPLQCHAPVFVCPTCRKTFTHKFHLYEHLYFHDME